MSFCLAFLAYTISVLDTWMYGVTMCVIHFDVALVHFHIHVNCAFLIPIFGMMVVFNLLCAHKNFHDCWIHFCFNMEFWFSMSNYDHPVYLLPYLVQLMTLPFDLGLVLFRTCSYLNKCASCWILVAVLTFCFAFDPSLGTSGLYSRFELCISGSSFQY